MQTSARRELVSHFQRVRPRATARATESNRIICIERGDSRSEQRRPRKINSCFYKTPESHRPLCRPVRGESSSHIFRGYAPAQRRVRLSPIESFVLNAATAADEQRRPRKISSCFYKTPESHSRPVVRCRSVGIYRSHTGCRSVIGMWGSTDPTIIRSSRFVYPATWPCMENCAQS